MPPPLRIVTPWLILLADDLTGANDSGGQLARHGFSTRSYLTLPPAGTSYGPATALLFNSDTRALSPREAYRKLQMWGEQLPRAAHLFKKVDSLLRGHLGQELSALLDSQPALNRPYALIAPAFPANGRTTRDGRQWIHGQPVHTHASVSESAYAPSTSDLQHLLVEQTQRRCELISLQTVRQGVAAIERAIRSFRDRSVQLIAADAESDADLDLLVQAALSHEAHTGEAPIWTGAAGLAGALALQLTQRYPAPPSPPELAVILNRNDADGRGLLLISGTQSPITRAQIDTFDPQARLRLALDPGILTSWTQDDPAPAPIRQSAQNTHHSLRLERPTLITVSRGSESSPPCPSEGERAAGPPLEPLAIARSLGRFVHLIITQSRRPRALFLTGGDTAQHVLGRLGISSLWVTGEILPGIPECRAAEGPLTGLPIVTKSGGFGSKDALRIIVNYLEGKFGTRAR